MSPDRVVVGIESERARKIMTRLYRPFLTNHFRVYFMDIPSAEMTKYAANAMLATRVSFMNDIANLCERVGADVNMVRRGIGFDSRIGKEIPLPRLRLRRLLLPEGRQGADKTAEQNGYPMRVLQAVDEVNEVQKSILFRKLEQHYGGALAGKTVALWGLRSSPKQMTCAKHRHWSSSTDRSLPVCRSGLRPRGDGRMQTTSGRQSDLLQGHVRSSDGCRCAAAADRMERVPRTPRSPCWND